MIVRLFSVWEGRIWLWLWASCRTEKDECDFFFLVVVVVVLSSEKDECACVLFAGLRTDECGCDQWTESCRQALTDYGWHESVWVKEPRRDVCVISKICCKNMYVRSPFPSLSSAVSIFPTVSLFLLPPPPPLHTSVYVCVCVRACGICVCVRMLCVSVCVCMLCVCVGRGGGAG